MHDQRPFFTRVESLRGIGAMAVAAYHFTGISVHGMPIFPPEPWPAADLLQEALRRLGLLLMPGHGALMIFFVISGLVLRVSLGFGPQDAGPASLRFLVARVFRIYPIVVFHAVVVVLVGGWVIPQAPGQEAGPLTMSGFVANLLLLDVSLNRSLWALQVEVLMAPAILALYFLERRLGVRALAVVALVATPLSFSKQWALWGPLSHNVFPFVLGMLIPTIGREAVAALSRGAAARWALAGTAALVLPKSLFGMYSSWSALVEAYGAVVLVGVVAYRTDLRALRFLDSRPLRKVGEASGSYYVLHGLTMPAAAAVAAFLVPPSWAASAPGLVSLAVTACWLVGVAPLAICSFRLVEAPGVALGRRVIRAVAKSRRGPAERAGAPGTAAAPSPSATGQPQP